MTDLTNTTATEDDRNIIRIPSWNLERLDSDIAKLNKKAKKIGCPELSRVILNRFTKEDPRLKDDPDNMRGHYGLPMPKIEMLNVEILGEGPKIEGWKFLGSFDHVTLPGSVIVNTVPGETIPKQFHNCKPICDHCGTTRRRNETFLMQEEATGDYKLVGRQCVRDFIGYDAKHIFQFLSWIHKMEEKYADEDFCYDGGGQYLDMFSLDDVLIRTAAIIHKHGWVSKSKAGFDQAPTAGEVVYAYYPPQRDQARAEWVKWIEDLDLDNEKWAKEAAAARAWLKEQPNDNEYMHNLHTINDNPLGEVPTKLFGYWCSLMSSYQRAMETLRVQEKKLRVNEHVGLIKQRREFKVTLERLHVFEGQFGYTHIHTFLDNEGHTLVWFASSEQKFEVGSEYTIKGTVKKHDEYNNWAQTNINRVVEV